MSRTALLIDECLPRTIERGLLRRMPTADVLRVGDDDAPPNATPDDQLLAFCENNRRLLLTADRSTMASEVEKHIARGRQTWGVLVVRPQSSLSKLLDDLELVIGASEADEWTGLYEFIPF